MLLAAAVLAAGASGCHAARARSAAAAPEVWAFLAFWDERSRASLATNGGRIAVAVTSWIALDSAGTPHVVHAAAALPGERRARTLALVTSWEGDRFHPDRVQRLAADAEVLRAAATWIGSRVRQLGHEGVVLDFEGHPPSDLATLLRVTRAIAESARLGTIVVAIPAGDTTGYPAAPFIEAGATAMLPMLYDEHWAGGEPGPIASPAWVARWLSVRVREVGASRIVAGLPLYGYHWSAPRAGTPISHAEAVALALRAGTPLVRDSASTALRAQTREGELWSTDATTLAALLETVARAGVSRVALWHLGQEDPAIWPLLGGPP